MEEVVIVGGGVAGLACLNALVDCGVDALLLEAGTIGAPKICGEFLAPNAALQLEEWGIGPLELISQISFFCASVQLAIDFQAAAMERSKAEILLAKRARALGARIVEGAKIASIEPPQLTLADGSTLLANHLFIATGKLGQQAKTFPYIGLKTHLARTQNDFGLKMHLFEGGYWGHVPISHTSCNVACLMKKEATLPPNIASNQSLSAPVAPFGIKKPPKWPNSYFIGDASASLPPAAGGGFSHAISSSKLAVAHFLNHDPTGYANRIAQELSKKMAWAMRLHHVMLRPKLAKMAMKLLWPKATQMLMERLGLNKRPTIF